jgi:hypothetical protein
VRVSANTNKPFYGVGCLIVGFLTLATAPAAAHTPHAYPADLPDAPVLTGHIEHADILARELTIGDITSLVAFQANLGVPGRVLPAVS